MKKTLFAVLALLLAGGSAFAQVGTFEVLNNPVEQGGTVVIRILPQWREPFTCILAFGRHYAPDRLGYVYIGVSASERATKHEIYRVECGRGVLLDARYYDEIEVVKKEFQKTRTAGGGPSSRPRKAFERRAIDRALISDDGLNDDLTGGVKYSPPLLNRSVVIDPFGLIYRNTNILHSGVDLRVLIGTPVRSTNNGRVVLVANDYSKEGNMVIVSHGLGIFSVYMHLSRIYVREGDFVRKGRTIALSGDTGAGVREPHLHFSVKIHNSYVDPLEFIETVNKNR